jgi:hypothetical protein
MMDDEKLDGGLSALTDVLGCDIDMDIDEKLELIVACLPDSPFKLKVREIHAEALAVMEMLRSWETDAQRRADFLEQHLRYVLEIARTWTPAYATPVDLATLNMAEMLLTPNVRVERRACKRSRG